jgi:predicted nucleotidyltransferase
MKLFIVNKSENKTEMIHQQFAEKAIQILKTDGNVIGLAAAGSWITQELDEFSDLDLILVTKTRISSDKKKMMEYAGRMGKLLSGFTGEHVGEPRVLICLFDDPLLHVDVKFVTPEEFKKRIETPVILFDKDNLLKNALENSKSEFPYPDYQWIEDRFWVWIHYILLKVGRGEYLEAFDFFGFLRSNVFGPLLHIKNGNLPRGVRKVEKSLDNEDLKSLLLTIPDYNKEALIVSLKRSIELYRKLRILLYDDKIRLQEQTEKKVVKYLSEISLLHPDA